MRLCSLEPRASDVTTVGVESNEGLGTMVRMIQRRGEKATSVYRELARTSVNTAAPND